MPATIMLQERNRRAKDRIQAGWGPVGKVSVADVRERPTMQVSASVFPRTHADTLQVFVRDRTADDVTVCTDDVPARIGIDRKHETVNHSAGEHGRDKAHARDTDRFRSMSRRCFNGIFHKPTSKHTDCHIQEFGGQGNVHDPATIFQMTPLVREMVGKRLCHRDPVADNGLSSGAER